MSDDQPVSIPPSIGANGPVPYKLVQLIQKWVTDLTISDVLKEHGRLDAGSVELVVEAGGWTPTVSINWISGGNSVGLSRIMGVFYAFECRYPLRTDEVTDCCTDEQLHSYFDRIERGDLPLHVSSAELQLSRERNSGPRHPVPPAR